jgi:hypothetical protein
MHVQHFAQHIRPVLAANETSRKTERRVYSGEKWSLQPPKLPPKGARVSGIRVLLIEKTERPRRFGITGFLHRRARIESGEHEFDGVV